jgi:hypothetical protein
VSSHGFFADGSRPPSCKPHAARRGLPHPSFSLRGTAEHHFRRDPRAERKSPLESQSAVGEGGGGSAALGALRALKRTSSRLRPRPVLRLDLPWLSSCVFRNRCVPVGPPGAPRGFGAAMPDLPLVWSLSCVEAEQGHLLNLAGRLALSWKRRRREGPCCAYPMRRQGSFDRNTAARGRPAGLRGRRPRSGASRRKNGAHLPGAKPGAKARRRTCVYAFRALFPRPPRGPQTWARKWCPLVTRGWVVRGLAYGVGRGAVSLACLRSVAAVAAGARRAA